MNSWSTKSANAILTLDPDLRVLCNTVLQIHDCSILWGYRNEVQQNGMFIAGNSKLKFPDSKHNRYFSEAVDLVPYLNGRSPYEDPKYVGYFCGIVLGTADALYREGRMSKKIRWGGNWSVDRAKPFASFFDGYHFELSA